MQWIDVCLDYLSNEMYQMKTQIGRIAHRQARINGFGPSPSPFPEASADEDDDAGDDEDDASSFGDDEITTSQ